MSDAFNPVVKMLAWRVRKLSLKEVAMVLAAVASMGDGAFTLTDVIKVLPREFESSRKKRRSVGTLLQNLANLGYLSKPSERKWVKNYRSFSHFLTQHVLELSLIEKSLPASKGEAIEERVVSRREKLRKSLSRRETT